jgi:uncharacterized membrane protein
LYKLACDVLALCLILLLIFLIGSLALGLREEYVRHYVHGTVKEYSHEETPVGVQPVEGVHR